MFSLNRVKPASLDGIDNVVWFGRNRDKKRVTTQWSDPEFLRIWDKTMRESFDILGMVDRFMEISTDESGVLAHRLDGLDTLVPVPGYQNRNLLRKATSNIDEVTTRFERVPTVDGMAVRYTGDREQALEQWKALTDLLGQTTIMAIVTPGLLYYVQGTQVGYTPGTRHLFRRSNTVERIGLPNEPCWRANVSGHRIEIYGKWDEIKRIRRELGYSIFHMLQIRLNEELEKAVARG